MHGRRAFNTIAMLVAVLTPIAAAAQPDKQLWAEVKLDWIKNNRLTFGVDTEPKVLVSKPADDPGWSALDVTPSIEYTANKWFDVVGELQVGRTRQTNDVDSTEVAPRVGLQFHILSNVIDAFDKENRPRRRFVLSNLLRLEWRNLYYSNDQPDSSTRRLRDRVEVLYALNRRRITDDGATYLHSDVEWFWPRNDPDERFANQQRIRAGVGYRHSFSWRFEALYVWNRSRNSANEGFTSAYHALDLQVKRVW
jgi:Protein of unknown function (DUF2490)